MLGGANVAGYYESRASRGDAYAPLALDVVRNEGVLGSAANMWLFSMAAFSLSDQQINGLLAGGTYMDFVRSVNVDLAHAHAAAVGADRFGVPGLLSANQISAYHEAYFQGRGLPAATFGGSFFFGMRTDYWCGGCDSGP